MHQWADFRLQTTCAFDVIAIWQSSKDFRSLNVILVIFGHNVLVYLTNSIVYVQFVYNQGLSGKVIPVNEVGQGFMSCLVLINTFKLGRSANLLMIDHF